MSEEGHQYRASIVREGDWILVYLNERRKFLVRVRKGELLGSDKGVLKLDDVIGLPYGSKVKLSTGYEAYILRPLFHDFFLKYRRVTQVIYPKDLGFIIFISGISSGSRVLEAGVGTGFLTTTLANVVKPDGRVYAYDVRREFLEAARRNLELSGLIEYVELKLGDIRQCIEEKDLDAAFLDIPDPWNALDSVHTALKPSAPIIAFMPTINQVEKLVTAMKAHGGFIDVNAIELILREYIVKEGATRPRTTMIAHTGYIVYARTCSKQ